MKVSVITPMYNCEKFISETIESVLNQTYTNWEMIIIDDCSTDKSKQIVKQYIERDKRIRLIALNENSGAAVARNKGIEVSSGRFIAFLDGDDLWESNKLEKQIQFMTEKNIGFSFTYYEVISETGIDLNKTIRVPNMIDYEGLLGNTIIGCLTVVIDRNIIRDVEMPLIRTRQDFATWLNILKKGYKAYGIDIPLAKYRIVKGSISNNKFKAAMKNWHVYRKIEKLSLSKAIVVFLCYVFNAIKKRRKNVNEVINTSEATNIL